MFYFNSNKFNFWPVYDAIKKFYPIGIESEEPDLLSQYHGIKELESIIVDNTHDQNNFHSRWETFEEILTNLTHKRLTGTTYGQAPSFSACIEIENIVLPDRQIIKEVFFAVSFVGPFYTAIGRDKCLINLPETGFIDSTNYIVISPEGEFKETFDLVCNQIEEKFQNFRFVPFEILSQELKGLEVHYSGEHSNKVFHAIFNHQIDLSAWRIGNPFHKYSDWNLSV
jgi:hypothetical protein